MKKRKTKSTIRSLSRAETDIHHVLVRAPNWIGDCIMASRALHRLRDLYPDSRIDLICRPHLLPLFRLGQPLDQVIAAPVFSGREKILACASLIRQRGFRYDLGVLFTNSFSTALTFRLGGVRRIIGYARDGRSFLLHHALSRPETAHQTDRYDQLLSALGASAPAVSFPFLRIPQGLALNLESRMIRLGISLEPAPIVIAPGAAYGPAKRWPMERFAKVIDILAAAYPQRMILCLGGSEEAVQIEALLEGNNPARTRNLAGVLPLDEAVALIARAACVLANDSGLMHAAWAFDVPLLAIFGPTDPSKSRPLSNRSRVIYKKAECSPCPHRRCPVDHRCMNAITVEEVVQEIQKLLGPP